MKKLVRISKETFLKLMFICVFAVGVSTLASAQVKIKDFTAIETEVQKGSDSFKNIAIYVLGTVLAIALIFVVWEIASGKPHAKEHLIAWLIAVGVVILAGFII